MSLATHPLQLAAGLTLWSLWFVAAYGGLSLGCAFAGPPVEAGAATWINAGLASLSGLTIALLLCCAWRCSKAARAPAGEDRPWLRFVAPLAAGLHLVAAVSTLFVSLPLIGLPPCM